MAKKNPFFKRTAGTGQMNRPEGAGNFDNADDYNYVDSVNTKTGTIQHTPSNAKDIVNKEYADSLGADNLGDHVATQTISGAIIHATDSISGAHLLSDGSISGAVVSVLDDRDGALSGAAITVNTIFGTAVSGAIASNYPTGTIYVQYTA